MPTPSLPHLFIDFSALHSSETRNVPAKVTCLATSVILAFGSRRESSTERMEGNDSQYSASLTKERGLASRSSHPRDVGGSRLPSPSAELSLYVFAHAGIGPTPTPRREFSAFLTSSSFLLNSHNSLQKQVFAKPSCSDP